MQEGNPAIERSPQSEEIRQVVKVFQRFGRDNYAFVPFQSTILATIFRNIWLVFLLLIVFLISVALFGYLKAENPQLAVEIMLEGEPRMFTEHDTNPLGTEMYRTGRDYYVIGCDAEESTGDPGLWLLAFDNGDKFTFRSEGNLQCLLSQMGSTIHTLFNLRVYILPLLIFFLVASLVYSYFIRSAPQALFLTANAGRLLPNHDSSEETSWIQPNSWHSYVADMENSFSGRWRNYCLLLFTSIVMVFNVSLFIYRNSYAIITSGYLPSAITEIIIMIVIPIMLCFIGGAGFWTIIVVAIYLRWISPTYKLSIQPDHPDTCGGLKRLGDICLIMALIALIPGAILVLWMATGALVGFDTLSIVATSGWLIIITLACITFFLPVTRIHAELTTVKESYIEEANANSAPVKNRLRELISQGKGGSSEARSLYQELEMLYALYPPDLTFHTWPFDTRGYAAFIIGIIVPIILAIVAR